MRFVHGHGDTNIISKFDLAVMLASSTILYNTSFCLFCVGIPRFFFSFLHKRHVQEVPDDCGPRQGGGDRSDTIVMWYYYCQYEILG